MCGSKVAQNNSSYLSNYNYNLKLFWQNFKNVPGPKIVFFFFINHSIDKPK